MGSVPGLRGDGEVGGGCIKADIVLVCALCVCVDLSVGVGRCG